MGSEYKNSDNKENKVLSKQDPYRESSIFGDKTNLLYLYHSKSPSNNLVKLFNSIIKTLHEIYQKYFTHKIKKSYLKKNEEVQE